MGVLDKLNQIKSCKENIKQAIEDKGVDMTDVAFTEYAEKIGEIQTGGGSGDFLDIRNNMTTYYSTAESVPVYAFAQCYSLTSVNLPNCVSVGNYVFQSCPSLQSVNLPMCSSVGRYTFQYCSSLQSVNLPMCEIVDGEAFAHCSSLTSMDLPNCSLLSDGAFSYCYSLSTVNLPVCGNISGYYTFANCSSLSVLDLRSTYSCSLSNSNAFSRTPFASGIGSIYVHNTVLSQFQNATNWTYYSNCFVGVGDATKLLLSFDNGRVYGDTTGLYSRWTSYLGVASSSVISIDLPNVKNLLTSAGFSNFYNLTSVSMNTLVSAPNEMCYNCKSLQSIDLPMCSYVGVSAFASCKSLTSIYLPNCSYIGISAFYNCSSLQSVDLPNCSYIGNSAFYNCKSLQSIDLPMCSYVGVYAFYNCSSLQSVDLPNCSYIGKNAFPGCQSLQSVDLPNCSCVDEFAFANCSSLQSVNLPMCSYVGRSVFAYCSSLQSVNLPMCEYVGSDTFKTCSSLQSVNLPMCEYVGGSAFYDCNDTLDVYIGTSISKVCQAGGVQIFKQDWNTGKYLVNKIFVPMSLVDAYKSAQYWSDYASLIYGI